MEGVRDDVFIHSKGLKLEPRGYQQVPLQSGLSLAGSHAYDLPEVPDPKGGRLSVLRRAPLSSEVPE